MKYAVRLTHSHKQVGFFIAINEKKDSINTIFFGIYFLWGPMYAKNKTIFEWKKKVTI